MNTIVPFVSSLATENNNIKSFVACLHTETVVFYLYPTRNKEHVDQTIYTSISHLQVNYTSHSPTHPLTLTPIHRKKVELCRCIMQSSLVFLQNTKLTRGNDGWKIFQLFASVHGLRKDGLLATIFWVHNDMHKMAVICHFHHSILDQSLPCTSLVRLFFYTVLHTPFLKKNLFVTHPVIIN